tara:strand:- start:1247 stop:1543 length:297 start_codon:yes stop_codon:yes gene_type:complete
MTERRQIVNPETGKKVFADGVIGKRILAARKNARKKTTKKSPKNSRKSGKGHCTKRKSPRTCGSEPNCSWRKKSKTCVRQKGVRKGTVYEGPMLKNDY